MKIFKNLTLLAFLALSTSCGSQDPFAGQPDSVRKAIPPWMVEKPKAPEKIGRESMYILSSQDSFFLTEAVAGEATFRAQVFLKDVKSRLEIANLKDFPGATFDQSTGKFTWMPPKGFVLSRTDSTTATLSLHVVLITEPNPDYDQAIVEREFAVVVSSDLSAPSIVSVEDIFSKPYREGTSKRFTVVVRDETSNLSRPPSLRVVSSVSSVLGGPDIASFIELDSRPSQDAINPTLWTFWLTLNTEGQKIVAPSTKGGVRNTGFALEAWSSFMKRSALQNMNVTVWSGLEKPEVSLQDTQEISVKSGSRFELGFTAYDPSRIARMKEYSFVTSGGALSTATLNCDNSGRKWQYSCVLSWLPPMGLSGQFYFDFNVVSQSAILGDEGTLKRNSVRVYLNVSPQLSNVTGGHQ